MFTNTQAQTTATQNDIDAAAAGAYRTVAHDDPAKEASVWEYDPAQQGCVGCGSTGLECLPQCPHAPSHELF